MKPDQIKALKVFFTSSVTMFNLSMQMQSILGRELIHKTPMHTLHEICLNELNAENPDESKIYGLISQMEALAKEKST